MRLEKPHRRPWTSNGGYRLYFAYGMNMHRAEMAHRCPGALLRGTVRLEDYRFLITARGVATVVPAPNSLVHGVLWNLTSRDEANLDSFEGVRSGFYRKRRVTVLDDSGEAHAFVYVASNSTPGRPRPGYLETILEAARCHEMPEGYLIELTTWFQPTS